LISNRRLINVPRNRQAELGAQFTWLHGVHADETRGDVQMISVSVFDHWLSREDACKLLEDVPIDEQKRRDGLLGNFCTKMISNTEVLSFVMRGRKKDQPVFRTFKSKEVLADYCKPSGGRSFKHRDFHVVLPELGCAFYESWDDTYHFFFISPGIEKVARDWARESGVYVLAHSSR
jgi:hypothetical protein